jgi:hypothetical protein
MRETPLRIGLPHVRHVEAMTTALRAMDHRYGGDSCRDVITSLLSWCSNARHVTADDAVAAALRRATADLHNLAGWTAFDMGLGGSAHRQFTTALRLADDPELKANVLYRTGRVHLHHDGPVEALRHFQEGTRVARTPHSRAILTANEAWALAELGDRGSALAVLGRAHDLFAQSGPEVPGWARFFDETDLSGVTGVIHTVLGDTAPAITALTRATRGYQDEMARSRTFSLIALALNHLRQGDRDEATAVAATTVELSADLTSARIRRKLTPLRAEAVRCRAHDLTELIDPLLAPRAAA